MFGWESAAAAWASTMKRSLSSAEWTRSGGRNFRATGRLSLRSSARQTIPIPPWPIFPSTRYFPAMMLPAATVSGGVSSILVMDSEAGACEVSRAVQCPQYADVSGFSE